MSGLYDWEQRVADQLADQGSVNLTGIGGVEAIPDDGPISPLFPDVAEAIVGAFPTLPGDQRIRAVTVIGAGVAGTGSATALQLLCDVVVPVADDLGATNLLKSALRRRVADRSDERHAAFASVALKALCHLALVRDDARFLLFDALASIGTDHEHEVFAVAASWVAGVVFDRWREQTAADCLERLTGSDGDADASFWFAQTKLVAALELNGTDTIRAAMRDALEHLDRAAAQGEDRPDAVLYAATVRFITDYSVQADPARLAEHLATATTAFEQYIMDGIGLRDLPPWMRPRFDAEARWVQLLDLLQTATQAEDRDNWYDPPRMIDALADAYTAAHTLTPTRSYLSPDQPRTIVVDRVVPRIASPFIDRVAPLAYVDQWLDQTDHPDAEAFRDEVQARVNEAVVDGGKAPAAGDYPAVAKHLGAVPTAADPYLLAQLEHVLEDFDSDKTALKDRVVAELLDTIHTGLAECPDFTGDVRTHFTIVIDQIIRFLHVRMNVQHGTAFKRFAYLYDPNAHEMLLGADLRDFIVGNVGGVVHCEVQELAGGRTDLIIQFDGFKITIELKREKRDVTKTGLAKYLPQLAAYESTDVSLGMLVVLDLTDKPTGAANIRDNAWVDTLPGPNHGDRDRFAVVVRVPGNRQAPSSL